MLYDGGERGDASVQRRGAVRGPSHPASRATSRVPHCPSATDKVARHMLLRLTVRADTALNIGSPC